MEREERYEVDSAGRLVVGKPVTLTTKERADIIIKMFSVYGWRFELLQKFTDTHWYIRLENENLNFSTAIHLFHGNVRKEDPERNRAEKKIQLGLNADPRRYKENAIILGFYIYDSKEDAVVVAWPIEETKNYPANPSLRVNMRTDLLPAKNTGYYIDRTTGKNLVVFRPEFIYHYLEHYKELQYDQEDAQEDPAGDAQVSPPDDPGQSLEEKRVSTGCNVLIYGVPGSGKSWTIAHEYQKPGAKVERVVFHPDYTYADFIGQILPSVAENGQVSYAFAPGPFTRILKDAYQNPGTAYIFVIEEINRGNAPAIFGDVFQLLDRKAADGEGEADGYPAGTSEYGITNADIAREVYGEEHWHRKVRIPSNLSLIGTMNTSDQNVFTLDTAFQRRWEMRLVENDFDHVDAALAEASILDTGVTWKNFCTQINQLIVANGVGTASSEDKRLGVYFVNARDLVFDDKMGDLKSGEYKKLRGKENAGTLSDGERERLEEIVRAMRQNRRFPEKVIKYLWDDAFLFHRELVFETDLYQSLEQVIHAFLHAAGTARFDVFQENIRRPFVDLRH